MEQPWIERGQFSLCDSIIGQDKYKVLLCSEIKIAEADLYLQ